jgi:hypothetical protein
MVSVVDIIKDVVTQVQLKWDSQAVTPEKPYFMHGHFLEMVNTLTEKGLSREWKSKKFPCIMLIQDFEENVSKDIATATIRVIIATYTESDIKAASRYDLTFKPTLYPLADLFLSELARSRSINQSSFEYSKYDRLYWGDNEEANMANDYVDAIEIDKLKINILKTC